MYLTVPNRCKQVIRYKILGCVDEHSTEREIESTPRFGLWRLRNLTAAVRRRYYGLFLAL